MSSEPKNCVDYACHYGAIGYQKKKSYQLCARPYVNVDHCGIYFSLLNAKTETKATSAMSS